MAWLVTGGQRGILRSRYIVFDQPGETYATTDDPRAASRFETRKDAESAAFGLVVKRPNLLGRLGIEHRPVFPTKR